MYVCMYVYSRIICLITGRWSVWKEFAKSRKCQLKQLEQVSRTR